MKLAICICTHQRPAGLLRLLKSLETLAGQVQFAIFVVDNHQDAEGLKVIEEIQKSGYSVAIQGEQVLDGGISQARNHVLQMAINANAQFVAFIDDDEWPEASWLDELMRVQAIDDADAVGGPTKAVFEADISNAFASCPYYGADLNLPDNAICELQACGNVLLKLQTIAKLGQPYFDPALGQSGGEDLKFFMRLKAAGLNMRWAAQATVFETVPPSRSTLKWLKHRVALIANTRVHIMQQLQPGLLSTALRWIKTLALGSQAASYQMLALIRPDAQFNAQLYSAKFNGKIRAHFGQRLARGENH